MPKNHTKIPIEEKNPNFLLNWICFRCTSLEDFENKKIKPQSEIDEDIFWLFMDDVENRASIDYLEEHYDIEDEPFIVNGGKYFYKKGQELRRVYQKYSNTNWGKLVP